MSNFEYYAFNRIHFSGVFSRLRLFLTNSQCKEKLVSFSCSISGRSNGNKHQEKKTRQKTQTFAVLLSLCLRCREAPSESVEMSCFFFLSLNCVCVFAAFTRLQNIGHLNIDVCVQRTKHAN